jgi:A/G-specific adenine glycosylase
MDNLFDPLIEWFVAEGRGLPWRKGRSPYSTWVSEVMLQQTQVAVVIPYYLRWMERFPTIEKLATASWEEVVKLWEGLGYYSRAKNLHQGAKEVLERFGGVLPREREVLLSIRGIGPYTAGAILSFAFHQRRGAIDGNVARVLSRLFLIEEPIDVEKTKTFLLAKLEEHLPVERSWVAQEGLIELGALLCQRKATCLLCPLKNNCTAFQTGRVGEFPKKKNKVVVTRLFRNVAVIESEDALLFRQGKEGEVMGYLYEFPYVETTEEGVSLSEMEQSFSELLGITLSFESSMAETSHGFTRYQVALFPHHFRAKEEEVISPYLWVKKSDLETIALSSGHRRVLKQWLKNPTPSFI